MLGLRMFEYSLRPDNVYLHVCAGVTSDTHRSNPEDPAVGRHAGSQRPCSMDRPSTARLD